MVATAGLKVQHRKLRLLKRRIVSCKSMASMENMSGKEEADQDLSLNTPGRADSEYARKRIYLFSLSRQSLTGYTKSDKYSIFRT